MKEVTNTHKRYRYFGINIIKNERLDIENASVNTNIEEFRPLHRISSFAGKEVRD
jgi:hypothetical protein